MKPAARLGALRWQRGRARLRVVAGGPLTSGAGAGRRLGRCGVSEGELLTGWRHPGDRAIGDTVRRPLRPFSLTRAGFVRPTAELDPVFRKLWEDGAKDELPPAEAWRAGQVP